MDFWVQLCVFSVIFNSQMILCVTEFGKSWAKLKSAQDVKRYRPALQGREGEGGDCDISLF